MKQAKNKGNIKKNSKKVKKIHKQKRTNSNIKQKGKEQSELPNQYINENDEISVFADGSFSVGLHDSCDYSQINDYGVEVQEHDDYEGAMLYFNKAIELAPEKDQAYYFKSVSLHKLNRLDKALKYIRKALELDPTNEDSLELQSKIIKKLNRQGKQIQEQDKKQKSKQNLKKNHFRKGIALLEDDNPKESISLLNQNIKVNPKNYKPHQNKIDAFKFFNKAQVQLLKALNLNPNDDCALFKLANSLREQHKYKDSIPYYDQAIKLNPDESEYYLNKGLSLQDNHQYGKAIVCFDQILNLDRDSEMEELVLLNKGLSLGAINRYQEQLACYDNLIKMNPRHAEAYYLKGLTLQHLNGFRKSLEFFEKTLKINPKHAYANMCRDEVLQHLELFSKQKNTSKKTSSKQYKKKK